MVARIRGMVKSGEMDLKTAQLLLGSKGGDADMTTTSAKPDQKVHETPIVGTPHADADDGLQGEVDALVNKAKQVKNDALLQN